jgi:hypothetical protein
MRRVKVMEISQYAVAERNELSIVSYDKDFDRTEKGRVVPEDLFRAPPTH